MCYLPALARPLGRLVLIWELLGEGFRYIFWGSGAAFKRRRGNVELTSKCHRRYYLSMKMKGVRFTYKAERVMWFSESVINLLYLTQAVTRTIYFYKYLYFSRTLPSRR